MPAYHLDIGGVTLCCMGSLGTGELIIILIIVLLVFGGAKLPKLARSLGQAQKEFKDGLENPGDDDSA